MRSFYRTGASPDLCNKAHMGQTASLMALTRHFVCRNRLQRFDVVSDILELVVLLTVVVLGMVFLSDFPVPWVLFVCMLCSVLALLPVLLLPSGVHAEPELRWSVRYGLGGDGQVGIGCDRRRAARHSAWDGVGSADGILHGSCPDGLGRCPALSRLYSVPCITCITPQRACCARSDLAGPFPTSIRFISVRSLHAGTGHACMSIQARYLSLSALPSGRMDWAHRWRDGGCARNLRHGGSD